jgi:hypothetical protein
MNREGKKETGEPPQGSPAGRTKILGELKQA